MPFGLRIAIAAFDATAMTLLAYGWTRGSFANTYANIIFWGAAAAGVFAAAAIALGSAVLTWMAIGYLLFAGFLVQTPVPVGEGPHLLLLAFAVALMPVAERPRGSLALGLLIAAGSAVSALYVLNRLS